MNGTYLKTYSFHNAGQFCKELVLNRLEGFAITVFQEMKEKGFEHLTSIVNKDGYRSVPLIRIAQRAGLFELLSQDLVQRQLDIIYAGGLKKSSSNILSQSTIGDLVPAIWNKRASFLVYILGLATMGLFPAIFCPDFIKFDKTKYFLRKFWSDIFGKGYVTFENGPIKRFTFAATKRNHPNSSKAQKIEKQFSVHSSESHSSCGDDCIIVSKGIKVNPSFSDKFYDFLYRWLTWNFSTKVIMLNNLVTDCVILFFLMYLAVAKLSYHVNQWDYVFIALFGCRIFHRLRTWFARRIFFENEHAWTVPIRIGFVEKVNIFAIFISIIFISTRWSFISQTPRYVMGPFLQDDGSFYNGDYKIDNDEFKESSQRAIREKAAFVDQFYKDFESNDEFSYG